MFRAVFPVLLLQGFLLLAGAAAAQTETAATLELTDCRISSGPGMPGIAARCGNFVRPLDPADESKGNAVDQLSEYKDMLAEQRARQGQLRHVQQFLTSPLFLDLSDQPVPVSEDREAIEERKRDLDYRIKVLESLCAIMIQERDFLDRAQAPSETAEAESEDAKAEQTG